MIPLAPRLRCIWIFILIIITDSSHPGLLASEVEEERDKVCPITHLVSPERVLEVYLATKVTTPDDWINKAIEALNSVRHNRNNYLSNVNRGNYELCKISQFCSNSYGADYECHCIIEHFKTKYDSFSLTVFSTNQDIDDYIHELVFKMLHNYNTPLFETDLQSICVTFGPNQYHPKIITSVITYHIEKGESKEQETTPSRSPGYYSSGSVLFSSEKAGVVGHLVLIGLLVMMNRGWVVDV